MRIVLFGGAFDPFHLAHLEMIDSCWSLEKYDRLIVMPTGLSPHKHQQGSFAAYRYETCRLALQNRDKKILLSDDEIVYPGISYTVDTVKRLKFNTNRDELIIDLLIGSDSLLSIDKWYRYEQLLKEVGLVVAVRDPAKLKEIIVQADKLKKHFGTEIEIMQMVPSPISSTKIREILSAGENADHLLPSSVASFVKSNRIYAFTADLFDLSSDWQYLQKLEQRQWPLLTQDRRVHVLNVMQYAIHLAKIHQVNIRKAAIAGLLHDYAKYLPLRDQYGAASSSFIELNDKIVHAPACAYYVNFDLGIDDREILDAISYHTTSHPLINDLGKIIYLADKIEYGREFKSLTPIRQMAEQDLDRAMLLCLNEVLIALARQGREAHPFTKASYKTISRLVQNK